MGARAGKRKRRAAALVAVFAISAGAGVVTSPASALVHSIDELKAPSAFTVNSSNGYSIVVLGSRVRGKRPSRVTMYVSRPGELAIYSKRARVNSEGMWADFGALGRVAMRFHPSGKFEFAQPPCERRRVFFRAGYYAGSIVFHGEEGYTGLTARRAKADLRFFLGGLCPGALKSVGRGSGADLTAVPRGDDPGLGIEAVKNGPDKVTHYGAAAREKRGEMLIYRAAGGETKSSAFEYDSLLSTATVTLPAPFSGSATFERGNGGTNSWLGDLSVDFPGRSGVKLTGGTFKAKLAPGEFHPAASS